MKATENNAGVQRSVIESEDEQEWRQWDRMARKTARGHGPGFHPPRPDPNKSEGAIMLEAMIGDLQQAARMKIRQDAAHLRMPEGFLRQNASRTSLPRKDIPAQKEPNRRNASPILMGKLSPGSVPFYVPGTENTSVTLKTKNLVDRQGQSFTGTLTLDKDGRARMRHADGQLPADQAVFPEKEHEKQVQTNNKGLPDASRMAFQAARSAQKPDKKKKNNLKIR